MFKFQAPKNEKALFRIGSRVKCDYYPGKVFKVSEKSWDYHGTVFYTLIETTPSWRGLPLQVGGLKQKILNKA